MAERKYLKGGYLASGGQIENEQGLANFMKSSDDLGDDYSESGDIRIIDDEEEFENFLNESFVRRPPETFSKEAVLRSLPIRPNIAKAYPSSSRKLTVSGAYFNDFRPLRRGVQVRDSSNNVHDTTSRRTVRPQTSRYCLKWFEDNSEERCQGGKGPTTRTRMEKTRYDNVLKNNMSYPSSGRQLLISGSYVNDCTPLRRGVQVRDSSNNVHDTTSRRTVRPQTSIACLKWLEDQQEEKFQGGKGPTTRTTMEKTRYDNELENTMAIPALVPDHTSEVGNFKTSENDKLEAIESLPRVKRRHKKHKRPIKVPQGKALMLKPLHDEINSESDRKLDLVKGSIRQWLPPLLPKSPGNDTKGRVEFWRFHHTHPICAVGKESSMEEVTRALKTKLMWGGDVTLYRGANLIEAGKQTATLADTLGDVVYPVKLFTIQTPSPRIPPEEFQTSDPDAMDPYPDSAVRVKMSCGHATTPDNLYGY
ncbi:uncharacterized protein LOC110443613 [Mizuhopecten yessoensis]|uniref:Uncharacterized protein n=1 Tax=Mizuhopecten yessoensis TaxID=6573 RepID=A0A210PEL2_MIZYE|nr:uncharacterized protein LOC110443613 [Mizuhopecten yessoensis]XP_021343608.1 uncharacterized protein LOC110443613 [Mizuhopecten yessoensis]XP_021343609.1 uncharacterized protein LOC110443613 [Mizuhopecten yessoensis]XP_021343610.1 uncharacterized protein LOC110443613 [Mizuhopecten yessoensis]XP_021343611.1 uncharacterized protein LOC110443613 [Mizuhopecten yessoensis]XP_021343612.1 uncharacterized protein LOC110443613 [Mizuhopecten yessoensis]OWF34928.1 hypothetical protein KP79_PYT08665 [